MATATSASGRVSQKTFLSPNQLAELKKGPRTNILIGHEGNRFICLEGAAIELLGHFSTYARRKLIAERNPVLWIPGGSKKTITWIYKYMSAGGKEADSPLESLTFDDLALLYQHCAILEYKPLLNRIFGCLKGKLYDSLPTVDEIKFFQANISALYTFAIQCLAKEMANPWTCNYTHYLDLADSDQPFGHALGSAMQKILAERIKIGDEYYRHTKDRRVLWSKAYLDNVFIQGGSKLAEEKPIGKKSTAVMFTKNVNMSSPTTVRQKSAIKTKKPINCFKCGNVGHIARNCSTETTAKHPATKSSTMRESKTLKPLKNAEATRRLSGGPSKQELSKCSKCGRPGHDLRKCTSETSLNVAGKPMGQVRDITSRNKNYPRAQCDRVPGVIDVKGNGEGLKTCDREVKVGEMTRTGLVV